MGSGGGVALFVRNDIFSMRINLDSNCEYISLKMNISTPYFITCIYRPLNCKLNIYNEIGNRIII